MAKILISPNKYVQGAGELKNLGSHVSKLGKNFLILISESGYKRNGKFIEESFKDVDGEFTFEYFNGECSSVEVERIEKIFEEKGCDMVIGIGGGKIADTAKAVAYYKDVPVAICPTIASTDAPCSALSVLYTEDGMFDKYLFLRSNPDIVLMDTEIISKSPARLSVSGVGDALATYYEARACKNSDSLNIAGGKASQAAMALAELCLDILLSEGLKSKLALEAGACTESVEKIIEANTLLSGIGFESGGLAAAHSIHNGFTVLEECHHMYHGEKVAFGTLAQLVLEDAPKEELEEIIDFMIEMELPVTLEQLGIKEVSKEKIMKVAEAACAEGESIYNMPFEIDVEKVCSAILAADSLGKYYL